ncbi:stage VI sporulation protein D [Gracilibacillus xinjiangensis]|uniref:Stage VI sporulation protein D n=1 Tax=Gracilibacillus xinjiangensis TaxID=1193282 RepID=A0ABV8WWI8_9BACI
MQDSYTFTLNENITFHNDYPIKEMLGIGLEPVLSIEEIGDTLSIRGVMELKGEYIPSEERGEEEEEEINGQVVERIEVMSDDICEFNHKFVMDISIPMERVNQTSEVAVDVDHFDYAIQSAKCLNIEAVLVIKGLSQEKEEVIAPEETELLPRFETKEDSTVTKEEQEESFEFVVNEERELEENEEESNEETAEIVSLFEDNEDKGENQTEEPRDNISYESGGTEEAVDETEIEEQTEEVEEAEELVEEVKEDRLRVQARADVDDTSYLLNIFSEEEEMAYTKLKLYIVQPADQMQSIAERYNVTTRQIMRTNQLEDEDLTSGQLIYIPVASTD